MLVTLSAYSLSAALYAATLSVGTYIASSSVQSANTSVPITSGGAALLKKTLVRLEQPQNACCSILVTPAGIVMLARLVQKAKALTPIPVTLAGMTMLVRPSHSQNAYTSMVVTLVGIMTSVRSVQLKNASFPILVTLYVVPPFTTVLGMNMTPVYFPLLFSITSTVLLPVASVSTL